MVDVRQPTTFTATILSPSKGDTRLHHPVVIKAANLPIFNEKVGYFTGEITPSLKKKYFYPKKIRTLMSTGFSAPEKHTSPVYHISSHFITFSVCYCIKMVIFNQAFIRKAYRRSKAYFRWRITYWNWGFVRGMRRLQIASHARNKFKGIDTITDPSNFTTISFSTR